MIRYIVLLLITSCVSIADPLMISRKVYTAGCPVEEVDMDEVENMGKFLQGIDSRCKAIYGPTACLRKIVQKAKDRTYWVYCAHRS